MALHCMIDLETWGRGPTAQIISIGAVKFDPADLSGPFDNFHVAINPALFKPTPYFDIDPDTIMWWIDPARDAARAHWLRCEKLDLPSAIAGFLDWFGPTSLPTWGNGATFDNMILLNAIAACGQERPWQFWHDRCYRTLKNEWPEVDGPTGEELKEILALEAIPGGDVAHTALFDAQWQAIHMRLIYAEKERRKPRVPSFDDLVDPPQSFYPPADAVTGLSTPAQGDMHARDDGPEAAEPDADYRQLSRHDG